EGEDAVLPLHLEEPLGEELAHDPAPLLVAELGPDPERAELGVPRAQRPLGRAAEGDVDEVAGPELLPSLALEPQDRRHELLRRDGAVEVLGRVEARVAVAARPAGLAEVAEELLAAALDRLAQGEHGVEVEGLGALAL